MSSSKEINTWKGIFNINFSDYTPQNGDVPNIVIYRILTNHKIPFIMIGLYKNNDELSFYQHPTVKTGEDAVIHIRRKIFENKDCLKYRGFSNNSTIWIEYTDKDYFPSCCKTNDQMWWCLTGEILNTKRVLNIDISDQVIKFFEKTPDYLFICNEDGEVYETPTVCYRGYSEEYMMAVVSLGQCRETKIKELGPSYYLSSLNGSLHEAVSELNKCDEPKYMRCGIVRFAAFLGVSTIIEKVEASLECLNNPHMDCCDWNQYYNSVYLLHMDDYRIVLRDLDYVCLSYNYISSINNIVCVL